MPYAELDTATAFSFLRGASLAEELVATASVLGMPAIGVADRNTVAGVVRAHEAAKQVGIRVVVGSRLVFRDGTPDLICYPTDRAAWGRLTRLLTLGKARVEERRVRARFAPIWRRTPRARSCSPSRPSGSMRIFATASRGSATYFGSRDLSRRTSPPSRRRCAAAAGACPTWPSDMPRADGGDQCRALPRARSGGRCRT